MKRCTKCKEQKETTEFYKCKTHKDGLHTKCKTCTSTQYKQNRTLYRKSNKEVLNTKARDYHKNKKDGLYTVYLNVKENYVGTTNYLYRRIRGHKHIMGFDNSEFKILGKYETRQEALLEEASWHAKGYKGGLNWVESKLIKEYINDRTVRRREESNTR